MVYTVVVSGLYQRAMEYLESQRKLRLVRADDESFDDFDGSPDERAVIEEEIRKAEAEHRISVGPDTFRVTPRRSGRGFPLLVNLLALVVVAAGVVVLLNVFDNRETNLVAQTASIATAEGRVLSALRIETEEQLSEKQAEINGIQRRLAEAEAERERIRQESAEQLQAREAELRAELDAEREAERARLAGQNLSNAEREQQLEQFRRQQELELQDQLAAIQADAEAELAAQESAIEGLVAEYQAALAAARTEQETLETELQEREAELEAAVADHRSAIAEQEARLARERRAAEQLLQELQTQQERRRMILDQIVALYSAIRNAVANEQYGRAERELIALKDYLERGPIADDPELQRRRQVELFLADTLQQRIEQSRSADDADTRSLIESAGLVAEVGELVTRAESRYESGERSRARELYVAALAEIPAVELGYRRLREIEDEVSSEASAQIASLIERGNAFYRNDELEAAVELYGRALSNLPSPDDQLLNRLLDAGYELRARGSLAELESLRADLRTRDETIAARNAALTTTRAELDAALEDLQSTRNELQAAQGELQTTQTQLAAARRRNGTLEDRLKQLTGRLHDQRELVGAIRSYERAFAGRAATDEDSTQLELLESKLLILRIVGSDSIRAEYPGLYEELNAYLDALVVEQRSAATRQTLAELSGVLSALRTRAAHGIDELETLADDYPALAGPEAADMTSDFLSDIRSLANPPTLP